MSDPNQPSDHPTGDQSGDPADRAGFTHLPVMVDEIVAVFDTVPAGFVLDATLGAGGHSEALLDRRADLSILGIDRDPEALTATTDRLARFGDRLVTVHTRFDDLDHAMQTLRTRTAHLHPAPPEPVESRPPADDTLGIVRHPSSLPSPQRDVGSTDGLSGALFDLGVSSPQLDTAERGFSYRNDGPLDMRMDATTPWSAADVVNGYDVDELARVIRRYGDERFAGRIARAIVAARPIESTVELAAIVAGAIPAPARRTGGHPAKRTFQAIRIEVNAELAVLPDALDAAIDATVPGGRIAVLSYHSGEDRIVKDRFRQATGACDCPPDLPCVCGAVQTVRLVRGIAKRPSAAEQERNRRASSARLRVAERLAGQRPDTEGAGRR